MKKLFLALLLSYPAYAIENDKVAHTLISTDLSLVSSIILSETSVKYPELWGSALTLFIGLSREAYKGHLDKDDLAADIIGTGLGSVLCFSIRRHF